MSEIERSFNSDDQRLILKRLAADLRDIGTHTPSGVDDDMLSLIVDEARQGVDISRRYPTFYQDMLEHADLWQAFVELIMVLEKEQENELIPLPNSPVVNLDFLQKKSPQPMVELLDPNQWRMRWVRTFEQIYEIFSPPKLAYRRGAVAVDDPWFTLLKGDFEIANSVYAIVLDCTLSEEAGEALSPYLNLAVTLGAAHASPSFPLLARLEWGAYNKSITLSEVGRMRLPDIPLSMAFDEEFKPIEAEFKFTLETIA